jgi:hypothetical protein
MDEEKKPVPVQKMTWKAAGSFKDYVAAKAKADSVKGPVKVKRRPNGMFEVRVGTPKAKEPQPVRNDDGTMRDEQQ